MADPAHFWVKIRKVGSIHYFVRFTRHHPSVQYIIHPRYEAAYCFGSADEAKLVVDVLRAGGVDATVAWKAVKVPSPPPSISFTPTAPEHIQAWVTRILEVGSALGRDGKDRIDAGYRALVHDHHPDHGVEVGDMQSLNDAREWLRKNPEDDVPF